ncbi:MAG: hypothetical protein CBC49_004180 [Alphaproteobacteria bacterium TMED89]|nr:hypothetical protein [Rhodospirillaceae bacterium]RPH16348.1 MAG: hypothetical protein CBC49_004180 [Alphaproteobacteria bacterium TMED89]
MTYRRNDPNPFLLFLVILAVIGVFFLILLYTWEPPRPVQTIRQELERDVILGQDQPTPDSQP